MLQTIAGNAYRSTFEGNCSRLYVVLLYIDLLQMYCSIGCKYRFCEDEDVAGFTASFICYYKNFVHLYPPTTLLLLGPRVVDHRQPI